MTNTIRCGCGKWLKDAAAYFEHVKSPEHLEPTVQLNASTSARKSKPPKTSVALVYRPREPPAAPGPTLTPIPLTADSSDKANEQKCDCGRVIKGGANGLRDHRLNSAVHNKDTTKRAAKRTVTKKKGTASSSSSDGATGTWAVDKTSYRPRYMGSGGGMDWSICDKDCGWCGSCMDTAIVVWD